MTPLPRIPSFQNPLQPTTEFRAIVSSTTSTPIEENEFLKYLQSLSITCTTQTHDDFILKTFSHPRAEYIIEQIQDSLAMKSANMSFKTEQAIDFAAIKACASSFAEPVVSMQLIAGNNDDLLKLESAINAFAINSKTSLKLDFNAQALSQGWTAERAEALNSAVTVLNEATSPTAAILAIDNIKKLLFPKKTLEVDDELKNIRDANVKLAAVAGGFFQQASAIREAKAAFSEATDNLSNATTRQTAAESAHAEAKRSLEDASALLKQEGAAQQELNSITAQRAPLAGALQSAQQELQAAKESCASKLCAANSAQEAVAFSREKIGQIGHTLSEKSLQLGDATQKLTEFSALSQQYAACLAQLNQEIPSLTSAMSEQIQQISTAKARLSSDTTQIGVIREPIGDLEATNQRLSSQILQNSANLSSRRQELSLAQRAQQTATSELTQIRNDLAALKTQRSDAEKACNESKAALQGVSEKASQVHSARVTATELRDTSLKEVERLNPIVAACEARVSELSSQLAEIKTAIGLSQKKEATLTEGVIKAEAERDASDKSVAELQESIADLKSKLSKAVSERDGLEGQAAAAINNVLEAQNQFLAAFNNINEHIALIAPEGSSLQAQVKSIINHVADIAIMNSFRLKDADAYSAIAESIETLDNALLELKNIVNAQGKQGFVQTMMQALGFSKKAESQVDLESKIETFSVHCFRFINDGQRLTDKISSANTAQQDFMKAKENMSHLETRHDAESQALKTAQAKLATHQNAVQSLSAELNATKQELTSNVASLTSNAELLTQAQAELSSQTQLRANAISQGNSATNDIKQYTDLIQEANKNVDSQSAHYEAVEKSLQTITSQIIKKGAECNTAEQTLTQHAKDIESLESKIIAIRSNHQDLEKTLSKNTVTIQNIKSNIEKLSESSKTLSDDITSMRTALINSTKQLAQKNLELEATKALLKQLPDLGSVTAEVEALKASVDQLANKKEVLESNLPELEQKTTATQAAIEPAKATLDEKGRLSEEAFEKLTAHDALIAAAQNKLNTFQIQCANIDIPQIEANLATKAGSLAAAQTEVAKAQETLKAKATILTELQLDHPHGKKAFEIAEKLTTSARGAEDEPTTAQTTSASSHTSITTPSRNLSLVRGSLAVLQNSPRFCEPKF